MATAQKVVSALQQRCVSSCLAPVSLAAHLRRPIPASFPGQRAHATKPEATVYSGPSAVSGKKVNLRTLRGKYSRGEKLSMVTAYDYPSAVHVRPLPALRGTDSRGEKLSLDGH